MLHSDVKYVEEEEEVFVAPSGESPYRASAAVSWDAIFYRLLLQ